MQYRRADSKDASYLFTVNLANRKSTLLVDKINVLRQSIQTVKQRHPFQIDAMVVMPDHLHAVFTLPTNDNDYATRRMLVKAGFSRQIPTGEQINPSRESKRERGLWRRRYWEHLIRDDKDYNAHVNYIHYNPVKHDYVQQAVNWPHSSIHRFIKNGDISENGGGDNKQSDKDRWGER